MRSNKSSKKLLGRVMAMALAIIMTLGMPGVGQVFASAGDPEESIVQEVESDDVIVPEVVPDAPSGDTGAILDDTAQDGADIDPEGPGGDPGAPDAIPGDDAQDDNNVDPEGTEGDPGAIPDGGDIDPDADNGGQEELPGGEPEETPDETPDADPDLITAALEAFRIQYQAFVDEFDTEKACHLDGMDHACAYRDFDGFLAAFEQASHIDPDFDITGEPDYIAMIDDLTAKLSEAAVSAYVFRGEGVLAASYDSLDQFDTDAGRMAGLVQYMLPADQGRYEIVDMNGRITAAREDLIAQLETPDEPVIPESVQVVLDRYEILCRDIDGMTFDSILAEIDRIENLIRVILPEELTEDVSAISGYLPEIRSQRALAEFCNNILTVREKAAAGAYDNMAEGFDREAVRIEFDAIRDLARYMLDTELSSENYANGLKILENLELLMDTPVDAGLSEKAGAWLAKFNAFQESFNIEYQNRPYALEKAIWNLLTECGQLDPSDMLDTTIQAAKTTLDNMLRRIVVKPEIRGFLDAAYALLDAVNAGLDMESDEAAELASRVVLAMDLLTESDMENIEIVEAYQKLVDAGLVPGSDFNTRFAIHAGTGESDLLRALRVGNPVWQRMRGVYFSSWMSDNELFDYGFTSEEYCLSLIEQAGSGNADIDRLHVSTKLSDSADACEVSYFVSYSDAVYDAADAFMSDKSPSGFYTRAKQFIDSYFVQVTPDGDGFITGNDTITAAMVVSHRTAGKLFEANIVPYVRDIDELTVAGDVISVSTAMFMAGQFTDDWNGIDASEAAVVGVGVSDLSRDGSVCAVDSLISGTFTDVDGNALPGIELGLFEYDDRTDTYLPVERDIMGERIGTVFTDDYGGYLFAGLPEGREYHIAVRGVTGMRPADRDYMLMPVEDSMHGLSGWQYVVERHISDRVVEFMSLDEISRMINNEEFNTPDDCLQNVVRDFRFEAELPPYEVDITWLDMADTTLSNDRTHADFVWSEDNVYPVGSIRFDIQFNSDVPAGTELLRWEHDLARVKPVDELVLTYGDIDGIYHADSDIFNNVAGLRNTAATDGMRTLVTTASFSAGTKITIPVRHAAIYFNLAGSWERSTRHPFWFDGTKEYVFTDGLSNVHTLTFSRSVAITNLDVSGRVDATTSPIGNKGARVWSWNPYVESVYGMTKDEFEAVSGSDMLLFEYCYKVRAAANAFAYLDLAVSPSGSGVMQGAYIESQINRGVWSCCPNQFVASPLDGFDLRTFMATTSIDPEGVSSMESLSLLGNWAYGSLHGDFGNTISGLRGDGARVWVLVAYPKDEILTFDAEKTEASCELKARVSLAEVPDVYEETAHTETHLEPLNQFISEGSMYSLSAAHVVTTASRKAAGTALLLGGSPVYSANGYTYMNLIADGSYRFSTGSEPDTIALAIDAVGFTDVRTDNGFTTLGAGDYVFRDLNFINVVVGTAYFDDSGNLITGSVDYDTYGDDALQLYVCTSRSPDMWILDQEFHLRDIHNGSSLVFTHDDVIRMKLVYPNHRSYVNIRASVTCDIKNGPLVSELVSRIRDLPDDRSLANMYMPFYASLHVVDKNGVPKLTKPAGHVMGALAGELNNLSSRLYGDWYAADTYPLRHGSRVALSVRGLSFAVASGMSVHHASGRDIDRADFAFGAKIPMLGISPELVAGSNLERLQSADFRIVFPEWCEVVAVEPGINGIYISGTYIGSFRWPESIGVPQLSYDMRVNEYGETELVVHTTLEYDRVASLQSQDGLYYGGFSVSVVPRYSEVFTQDIKGSCFATINDGASYYRGDKVVYSYQDSGIILTCDHLHFSDVDGNGSTSDYFVRGQRTIRTTVTNNVQSSGLQLAAQGSDNEFWNRTATTHAGDPYSYRLTYAQMAETSKNVVLFDSLEDISGNAWTGKLGSLDLSDAKAKNLSVKVYGNAKNIDSIKYVQDNIAADDLSAGYDGWTLLTECSPADPDSYQIAGSSLANVKSVAFDFGGSEFAKDQPGKPSVVQIYLGMKAPGSGFNNGSNAIQNRAFYSDVLTGSGKARSVMANTVTVDLVTTVSYNVTKTVSIGWNDPAPGPGVPDPGVDPGKLSITLEASEQYVAPGQEFKYVATARNDGDSPAMVDVELLLDSYLEFVRFSESDPGTGNVCWNDIVLPPHGSKSLNVWVRLNDDCPAGTKISEMAVLLHNGAYVANDDVMVASIGNADAESARSRAASSGEWITSQDPNTGKLTIDKSGRPDNDLEYTYTLRFDMSDPGKGKYESISDLVLYDELESGTDSRYAGRLDGISITGLSYSCLWQDPAGGANPMSLVPGYGEGTFDLLMLLDESVCDIYVSAAGTAGDTDLPNALASVTGRTDWIKTDIMLSNVDKSKITAVAVYCPYLTTANTLASGGLTPLSEPDTHAVDGAAGSTAYTPAYLEVGLSMVHAGHEDYTGVDRILKNGVTAGFVQMGASEPIVDTRPDQTEIEVVYKNSGIVLPVTGGPGVTALCVTGLIFLVPAAFVLATKKRKDQ